MESGVPNEAKKAEFDAAKREMRAANDEWNFKGEPLSGPSFDRLIAAQEWFQRAHADYYGISETGSP